RISLEDDLVEKLEVFDPLTGRVLHPMARFTVYPSSHYVTPRETTLRAVGAIKAELRTRIEFFQTAGRLVEAQRIEQRTRFDLEMLAELGFCKGIENYSRHLSGRQAGEPPPTLIDYLPQDALMIIDESHVTIPQLGGMYKGDRSRKENLVEYGFRLPSALDNRPLRFDEFEKVVRQSVFVSATPADYARASICPKALRSPSWMPTRRDSCPPSVRSSRRWRGQRGTSTGRPSSTPTGKPIRSSRPSPQPPAGGASRLRTTNATALHPR